MFSFIVVTITSVICSISILMYSVSKKADYFLNIDKDKYYDSITLGSLISVIACPMIFTLSHMFSNFSLVFSLLFVYSLVFIIPKFNYYKDAYDYYIDDKQPVHKRVKNILTLLDLLSETNHKVVGCRVYRESSYPIRSFEISDINVKIIINMKEGIIDVCSIISKKLELDITDIYAYLKSKQKLLLDSREQNSLLNSISGIK